MFKRLFSARLPLMVYNPPAVAAVDYLAAVRSARVASG